MDGRCCWTRIRTNEGGRSHSDLIQMNFVSGSPPGKREVHERLLTRNTLACRLSAVRVRQVPPNTSRQRISPSVVSPAMKKSWADSVVAPHPTLASNWHLAADAAARAATKMIVLYRAICPPGSACGPVGSHVRSTARNRVGAGKQGRSSATAQWHGR